MPWPIQIQRLARELQKRLGIQGFLSLTLVEDLQPVVQVLQGPEALALRGEGLRSNWQAVGPVVGQNSRVGLTNPATSGRLAIIERVMFFPTVGTRCSLRVDSPAVVGTLDGIPRDLRLSITETTSVRMFSGTAVGFAGFVIEQVLLGAAQTWVYDQPVVVAPGTMFFVDTEALNTRLDVSIAWREFLAAPQELVVV